MTHSKQCAEWVIFIFQNDMAGKAKGVCFQKNENSMERSLLLLHCGFSPVI